MTAERLRRGAGVAAIVAVLFVLWEFGERWYDARRTAAGMTSLTVLVPTPSMIFNEGWAQFLLMQEAITSTLIKAGIGFGLGSTAAVLVASLYTLVPWLRALSLPLAYASNSFPVFGLVPVIVLAFGQDSIMTISVIAALLSYFPILITVDSALHRTPTDLLELGEIYSASRWMRFRLIQFPTAVPALFVGLRLAAPASIVGATVGELLGSSTGVGNIVAVALYQLQSGLMYAMLIEVAVVCGLVALAATLLERKVSRWTS
ncbi:ABC transporter permease subunit [Actinoplanes sp. NPDC051475]|uniref:ABC transporter permease n=1 Tax=Actinoplanes sp. NPDC051475 TaxID=3157225 RepID=UPI00344EF8DB